MRIENQVPVPSAMANNTYLKVGVIGGTGFYSLDGLLDKRSIKVETEFGEPSADLVEGRIGNVLVYVLARHGINHHVNPTEVNYRANLRALQKCGVSHIIAVTATGSLKEHLEPGDVVLLHSFIDRTTRRPLSFHSKESSVLGEDFGSVAHIPMHPCFCEKLRQVLSKAADKAGIDIKEEKGVTVTIEGPRFSSLAESNLFRSWGADLVNMTTVPEVVLAAEAGMAYASLAMVTDVDCWKEHTVVEVDAVMATLARNVGKAKAIVTEALKIMDENDRNDWDENHKALKERARASRMN